MGRSYRATRYNQLTPLVPASQEVRALRCRKGCFFMPYGPPRRTMTELFWAKVNKDGPIAVAALGPCWLWGGTKGDKGYGQFWNGNRLVSAHVRAYEYEVGAVPLGLELDHLCRNRLCVRPSHLEPVTHRVNVLRGVAGQANRDKTHCAHGHPFDAVNTYVDPSTGKRSCRECRRRWSLEYLHRTNPLRYPNRDAVENSQNSYEA